MNANSFVVKAALLLVSSLTVMAGATIAPALPTMEEYFSDTGSAGLWVRLILTLPALLIVLGAPLAGLIVDRRGRMYLLIPSMILYGLAGSSGLYLDSLTAILAGRALLGLAVAGIMTSATTLIADYYEGAVRSQFMGWQAAFMSFGGVAFLTGGGALAEISWRWPFSIYLLSILLVPLVLLALFEPVKEKQTETGSADSRHPDRQPVQLLGFIYGAGLFGMILFYLIPLQIPFFLKEMIGAGPTASGIAIAVSTLFGTVTSLSFGGIHKRMGHVPILGLNFALMAVGYLIIGLADEYITALAGLAVCGLGMGLMFPNMNVWLTSKVPAYMRGRAVGGLTTAIFLGQFLSPAGSQLLDLELLFPSAGVVLLASAILILAFRKSILRFTAVSSKPVREEVRNPIPVTEQRPLNKVGS